MSFKIHSTSNEFLAQLVASWLQHQMRNELPRYFLPPKVRHRLFFISNSGSEGILQDPALISPKFVHKFNIFVLIDVSLRQDDIFLSAKKPNGGLEILNEVYPSLVPETVDSEANNLAFQNAKDFIRYSRGKNIYVICSESFTPLLDKFRVHGSTYLLDKK